MVNQESIHLTIEDRLQILQNLTEAMQKKIDRMSAYIDAQSVEKDYIYRELWVSGMAIEYIQNEIGEGWQLLGIAKAGKDGERTALYFRRDKSIPFVEKYGFLNAINASKKYYDSNKKVGRKVLFKKIVNRNKTNNSL
jgi:malate synthase